MSRRRYDAVVVGAGPNGLAAAITLARAGRKVLVMEGSDTVGGGARSAELTLPGFVHDVCSAIFPLGIGSPFFQKLPLGKYGLKWIQPPVLLAHPFDDGTAAVLQRSVKATAQGLGRDSRAYQGLMRPLVADWEKIAAGLLGPPRLPRHPIALARFGLYAIRSAQGLAEDMFKGERARALFAGIAAHSMLPLDEAPSAAFSLMLGIAAHAVGWPVAAGGAQSIPDSLTTYLQSLDGEVTTGVVVDSTDALPGAQAFLFDVTPRQLLRVAGSHLPEGYRRQLQRFSYGPGVFKIDWALEAGVPWKATECSRAGTVHLGGTLAEVAASERTVARGEHPEKPYVIVAQQSLFDPARAPDGRETLWAYCHVPNGSDFDMTERIEAQIERFAPGFRNRVLARHAMSARLMEEYNPNYVGGDINGGLQGFQQLFTRPVISLDPYSTPTRSIYICSSSTPPGGGVHGMCGYHAALSALRRSL